ncbi:MAG: Na/Pi cotransporter family protein [Clostridiales bacterium]|nr:Na/Pi cotransporter family protein [Clostridiales bacterium]
MFTTEEFMQLIQSLVWLLAGVGVFIVGMNFMSDALEKSAGNGMKNLLSKISNNRFSGVGIGAGVTAIIQSSSATSVMVIGLVNAGVMTLMQATPIIMGANIGTTITGVLVALKNDYFNMLMYLFAFAGVMMSFFKNERIKIAGRLFSGLGLIFVGLNIMSSEQAFGNALVERLFINVFKSIDFPLLLILVGIVFTALIQSSSAATGVVITMVGTGILSLGMALFIILGANIGTCVTALLACVGANANSKRVAFIHFTFNVIGSVLFSAVIWIFRNPVVDFLISLFPGTDALALQMRVSVFHVVFNVSTTIVFLPFIKRLVKFSKFVIKDKAEIEQEIKLKYVDKRLLNTPSIALGQLTKEIFRVADMTMENLNTAMNGFIERDTSVAEQVTANNEIIAKLDKEISDYLVRISNSNVSFSNEKLVNILHHNLGDISRIADLSDNVVKYTRREVRDNLVFSEGINDKILKMYEMLEKQYDLVKKIVLEKRYELMKESDVLEDEIDTSRKSLVAEHIQRLAQGKCRPENNTVFINLVSNLERIGDHLNFIAHSLENV